jgi:Bacterial extracellular solute-binding proteins, family 5 Middle
VKRLVLRVIPDPTTRYAALKNGEIDVTYWMTASLGEDLRRTPGLTLRPVVSSVMQWVAFVDQWDPKSPWHDRRVRLAANLAIDRQAINQADAGTLVAHELDHSQHLRLLLGAASSAVRSRPREGAPRRGRISERIRAAQGKVIGSPGRDWNLRPSD